MTSARTAIIDIGSNSVRLVAYGAPARAPAILFNEKVTAGLGRGLAEGGMLEPKAIAGALRALRRFKCLTEAMDIPEVRTVATAAVRDSANGADFLRTVEDLGLSVELLSGEGEAAAAGLGVISAIPEADGIVGDLGGGSLELVRVRNGAVGDTLSLPIGVLRLAKVRAGGRGALDALVGKALGKAEWPASARSLPFYMVGGSWRSLARVHMDLTDYPLPVLHHYVMPPEAAVRLVRALGRMDNKRLKGISAIASSRVPTLGDAAALLATLVRSFGSSALIVSASGLREGLLYTDLSREERRADPLIVATREAGARQGRFDEHGDLLDRWIAPLFENEPPREARLRHAACLLGDVAWAANPDFRAERGLDVALHGNWTGIDARGRAMIGQALYTNFGGTGPRAELVTLLSPDDFAQAARWGLAMRLGQRLSGGVAAPLERTGLRVEGRKLSVVLHDGESALYGEAVERRHRQLASAFGLDPFFG